MFIIHMISTVLMFDQSYTVKRNTLFTASDSTRADLIRQSSQRFNRITHIDLPQAQASLTLVLTTKYSKSLEEVYSDVLRLLLDSTLSR